MRQRENTFFAHKFWCIEIINHQWNSKSLWLSDVNHRDSFSSLIFGVMSHVNFTKYKKHLRDLRDLREGNIFGRCTQRPYPLIAHRSKCFFCRNKNENVKLFLCSLIITIRGQKREKMRQKGVLKVPSWKKIIFQLRKNIFPTGK